MVTEGRIWYIVRDNVCSGASYTSEIDKLSYLMFTTVILKTCQELYGMANRFKYSKT